jgi:hypothetical protein
VEKAIDLQRARPVDKVCDSFTAEQDGIHAVLEDASTTTSPGEEVGLLTDSLSNIMSIHSPGARDATEEKIQKLLVDLADRGVRVSIAFIRGHNGTAGNEIVDALAKSVSEDITCYSVDRIFPTHMLKVHLKERLRRAWGAKLLESAASTTAYRAHIGATGPSPTVSNTLPYANRRNETTLNQMRMNIPVFSNGFQSRIGRKHSQVCECCGEKEDTRHILLDCEKYKEQRAIMEEEIYCEKYGIDYVSDLRNWKYREKKTPLDKYKYACEPDDIRVITHFPNQVIDFIKRCNFWESDLDMEWDKGRLRLGRL